MNAREVAIKYLGYRDRSVYEIKKHLREKGYVEEEILKTLDFLSECKLIDDENYCIKYIKYGIEKGRGPIRLERELREKGIDKDIILINMEAELDTERERELASMHVEKLLKQTDQMIDEKQLARIGRRLSSQGFHSNIIYELISMLREKNLH